MNNNLYFVRADDVDGENWDMHVVAPDLEGAYVAWLADQRLTADQAAAVFPEGAEVSLVVTDLPYSDSFVLGWQAPARF